MSEPLVRIGLIVGVVASGLLVGAWLRARASSRSTRAGQTGLRPGVYLFSSGDCLDCVTARAQLRDVMDGAFTEIRWEESPSTFGDLGVDVVPTTVIVADDGLATLHPGAPAAAIEWLNP